MLAVCARIRKIARPRQGLLWLVRLEPLAESGLEEPIVAALVAQAIQLAELLACRLSNQPQCEQQFQFSIEAD